MPFGPVCVRGVQGPLAGEQIHLGRVAQAGALEHFPKEVERDVNGNADVGGDEFIAVPWLEDVEAVEDDDDEEEEEGTIGRPGLEGRSENKRATIDALRPERSVELDIRDTDADPGEEVGDCGQVLEPSEHLGRSRGATEVG